MKIKVILTCSNCLNRNYHTSMNKQKELLIKKYCLNCKKHTLHKESK